MRYVPRQCEVHPFAAVLQLGSEDGGYGQRGIAISSANADTPMLWCGVAANVVHRVHQLHRLRVGQGGLRIGAVLVGEGGEVLFVGGGGAKQLVFAAAQIQRIESGRGLLAAGGAGIGGKVHGYHLAVADSEPVTAAQVFTCIQLALGGAAQEGGNIVFEAAVTLRI